MQSPGRPRPPAFLHAADFVPVLDLLHPEPDVHHSDGGGLSHLALTLRSIRPSFARDTLPCAQHAAAKEAGLRFENSYLRYGPPPIPSASAPMKKAAAAAAAAAAAGRSGRSRGRCGRSTWRAPAAAPSSATRGRQPCSTSGSSPPPLPLAHTPSPLSPSVPAPAAPRDCAEPAFQFRRRLTPARRAGSGPSWRTTGRGLALRGCCYSSVC